MALGPSPVQFQKNDKNDKNDNSHFIVAVIVAIFANSSRGSQKAVDGASSITTANVKRGAAQKR